MKPTRPNPRVLFASLATLAVLLPASAPATSYVKANTATMSNAADWAPTSPWPPTIADTLSWQSSGISLANNLALSLGMDFTCLGLDLRPNGTADLSLKIASGNTINLGANGANQSNGAWDSSLNCGINLVGNASFNIQGSMVVNGSITQDSTNRTLTKSGNGALHLTGTNSYAGGTAISGGVLTLGGSGTLGSTTTGALTLTSSSNGATLDLGGTTQTLGGITTFNKGEVRNGTIIDNNAGTGGSSAYVKSGVVSANLQGSGNLYLDDNGFTLKLSGTNTYSGTTIIQGGMLLASKPSALPNSGASGTITLNNNSSNANLAVRAGAASGEWASADIASLLANASLTCLGTAFFAIDTTGGNFSYGTAIPAKANMAFKKLGPNTLTLSAANLYPGVTNVNRGTVTVDATAGGSLATASGLTFSGTGTFNYNTAANSQSLGALTLSAGEGTVQVTRSADQALTFSSMAARTAGATGNFSLSGGTPSATNGFVLTGKAAGFIDQGTFFNGSAYAWMDATGTFARPINYSAPDAGASTSGATSSVASATHQQITGALSAQTSATFTTLNISGNNNITLADSSQILAVNGILKSGNAAGGATISGGAGIQAASGHELVVRTDGPNDTLNLSSVVGVAAASRTGTTASTSVKVVTGLSATSDLYVGETVVFTGFATVYTISSIDSTSQITLNANVPVTPTGTLNFYGNALTKSGAGTLTLTGANTLAGVNLNAGRLNIGSAAALGGGIPVALGSGNTVGKFTINEGTAIDNTSGAPLTMAYKYGMTWNGSFTFVGSNDLYFIDPSGNGNISMPNDITITTQTKDITLRTASNFSQTTARLTKNGPGTFQTGSNGGNGINGGLAINEGVYAGYWLSGGQPFQVFAGPVDLGDTASGNAHNATLALMQSSTHSAPITVRAGSSGTLAIYAEAGEALTGPVALNNALTLCATSGIDMSHYGLISGNGNLNIGNTGSFVIFGVTKSLANVGSVTLWRANTYSGNTLVNSGTLKLGAQASVANSPVISIAAGATLDVSQNAAFVLSGTNTLSAKGTGTTAGTTQATLKGGTSVSLGSQAINLTFTPTSATGDITHPSLVVSQGSLTLTGNVIAVNNAGTPLGAGVYRLIQVGNGTSGVITGVPSTAAVTVTGNGLAAFSTALASVSSGNVILTVTTKLPTSFSSLPLSQTVQSSVPSVALSGTVSAAGPTYPANGETVHVTINGVTQNTTVNATGQFTISYTTIPGAGTYPISYTYDGNSGLTSATDTSTSLTVSSQTVPSITSWPTGSVITYGQTLASSTLTGGSAAVAGTFSFTTSSTTPTATGTYLASGTFTPNDTASYTTVITPGAISVAVGAAPLAISSPAVSSRPYNGTTAATLTGTLSGVLAGDVGLVTLVGTGSYASPGVGTGIAVNAAASLAGTKAGNYALTQPAGLTGDITAATLTVTANNLTRAAGAANPTLTYTISGYQNGENAGSAGVTGAPSLATDANPSSPEGSYTITCAVNNLAAPSYTFTPVNGTLTVISSLTWAAGNGVWDINTTPNWKDSGGVNVVRYVDGLPVLFDNTAAGGGPFTVTLNTTVNPGALTISTTNKDYTLSGSGSVSGTAGLTKNGGGTLTVSTANAYNGGTNVTAGTFTLGNQNGCGTGTVTLAAGTTFQQTGFEGNGAVGALPNVFELSGSGNVIMNIPFAWKDVWFSHPITGSGGMTVQGGTRALTLTGNNSFGGGIRLTNGDNRVDISSLTALGAGTFRVETTTAGSGRLEPLANLSASPGVANAFDIASAAYLNINADAANHLWLAGPITSAVGTGNLYKTGTATLTLSGTNTYTGTTAVTAGTLLVNGNNSGSGAVSVSSAATLGGTGAIGGNVSFASGAFARFTNGGTLAIAGTLTLNGNVVHLALPASLAAGTYTLATYNPTGSTGSFAATPVIDSGALLTGGTATVATASGSVTLTVSTTFGSWIAAFPSLTGANALPGADPDGDSSNNLMEYGFATDPTVPSTGSITYANGVVTAHGQPVATNLAGEGGVDYRAVFGRRRDYVAAGLTYTVQFSAGLDIWVDSQEVPQVLASDSAIDAVSVPYPLFIPTSRGVEKPTFFRVGVSGN